MKEHKFGTVIVSGEFDVDNITIEKIISVLKGEFSKFEGEDDMYVFHDESTNGTVYYFDDSDQKFHMVFENITDKKKIVNKLNLIFNDLNKNNIFNPCKINLEQDLLLPINEGDEEVSEFFDSLVQTEKLEKHNPFKNIGVRSL